MTLLYRVYKVVFIDSPLNNGLNDCVTKMTLLTIDLNTIKATNYPF